MTMEVEKAEERARVARAGQRAEAAGVGKRVEVRSAIDMTAVAATEVAPEARTVEVAVAAS